MESSKQTLLKSRFIERKWVGFYLSRVECTNQTSRLGIHGAIMNYTLPHCDRDLDTTARPRFQMDNYQLPFQRNWNQSSPNRGKSAENWICGVQIEITAVPVLIRVFTHFPPWANTPAYHCIQHMVIIHTHIPLLGLLSLTIHTHTLSFSLLDLLCSSHFPLPVSERKKDSFLCRSRSP